VYEQGTLIQINPNCDKEDRKIAMRPDPLTFPCDRLSKATKSLQPFPMAYYPFVASLRDLDKSQKSLSSFYSDEDSRKAAENSIFLIPFKSDQLF